MGWLYDDWEDWDGEDDKDFRMVGMVERKARFGLFIVRAISWNGKDRRYMVEVVERVRLFGQLGLGSLG